jgi:hypothetical protein
VSDLPKTGRWGGGGGPITILAGVIVLCLALGALLWPGGGGTRTQAIFLVYDSTGDRDRITRVYEPFLHCLNEVSDDPLDLEVVGTVEAFTEKLTGRVDFVLCPDGLGLSLAAEQFVSLVTGRRAAPRNLRPRGVLVYRKSAGLVSDPWISRPDATACGDSVSLTATGTWRRRGSEAKPAPAVPNRCAWGPDPYDHAPVLHAARLGGFDYVLVRQWDADRFFTDGLLSPVEWGVEIMTVPVPDVVVFSSRSVPGKTRLAVGEVLSSLGRSYPDPSPATRELRRALAGLNLVGFNLLVDPDFELVRRNFDGSWPPLED